MRLMNFTQDLDLLQINSPWELQHQRLRELAPPCRLPSARLSMKVLKLADGMVAVFRRAGANLVAQQHRHRAERRVRIRAVGAPLTLLR